MVTEIVQKIGCGWCNTNDHEHCVGWVKSYDTIWVCGCKEPGCGVDSPRNTQRVATKPSVPTQEASTEPEVEPVTADTSDSGSAGQDAGVDPVKPATTGARRGRKPKAVADKPAEETKEN